MIDHPAQDQPFGPGCQAQILEEWHRFFERHPEIKTLDVMLADMSGIIRGKRLPADQWRKVAMGKTLLPGSTLMLQHDGANAPTMPEGVADGDPDHICWPVAGTLGCLEEGRASTLVAIGTQDGEAIFCEPRAILAGILQQLAEVGVTVQIAIELEFYMLDLEAASQGIVRLANQPPADRDDCATQVYHVEALEQFTPLFNEVTTRLDRYGISISAITKEFAAGQFEMNLNHSDNVLKAIDDAIRFKHCLRLASRRYGWLASFLGQPVKASAGSGMHIHCSLWDRQGRNLGLGGGKPHPQLGIQLTKELRHAIGGLQAMISPSMAIFASTMNAYRRLQSGVFAPVNTAWGYNNRNAALRIPAGEAQARRIEHRVASADANIYLSVAGVLAGIHYGLHEKLEPGEPTIGPILEGHNPAILGSWWEAIDCFEGFKPWQSYLGTQFHDRFARLQRSNLDLFLRGTHARDRALYLECL